jgi:hypothetical protein
LTHIGPLASEKSKLDNWKKRQKTSLSVVMTMVTQSAAEVGEVKKKILHLGENTGRCPSSQALTGQQAAICDIRHGHGQGQGHVLYGRSQPG